MPNTIQSAIQITRKALEENSRSRWVVGFSGGKDSTALLKIIVAAAQIARSLPPKIDVIYCDTGVENPILDHYVKGLFGDLEAEFKIAAGPFKAVILRAPVQNRFFVKVIGRGYPPPTNHFRWCTKNLRINPVAKFIQQAASDDAVVALGMRRAESIQRDRTLSRGGGAVWQKRIDGGSAYRMFLPIIDFDVYEVWDAVFSLKAPQSVHPDLLMELYRGASGECPIVKAPTSPPCASGRFGCWTCTVVRTDRSTLSLIDSGRHELIPYLEFRNWLRGIRNDLMRRWPFRRSGALGPGPFTLAARREILDRLLDLQGQVGATVLPEEERDEIRRLWSLDVDLDGRATSALCL